MPDDDRLKEHWLKYIGIRWRDFKCTLNSKYVHGDLKHLDPCKRWVFLDCDDWKSFKEHHATKEFEVLLIFSLIISFV